MIYIIILSYYNIVIPATYNSPSSLPVVVAGTADCWAPAITLIF